MGRHVRNAKRVPRAHFWRGQCAVIPNDPGTCPPPPPDPRPPQCAVKGNIGSGKGRPRIYHVPGSRGYEAVAVAPAKGERYFCSEQEAITCGWRKGPEGPG